LGHGEKQLSTHRNCAPLLKTAPAVGRVWCCRNAVETRLGAGIALWRRNPLARSFSSTIDFPVEPQDLSKIPPQFHRQMVPWDGTEVPGTVIVDPQQRFLYFVLDSGESALRYGVGVGRAGFAWSGDAVVQMKRRWPRWVPPEDMIGRDERAAKWANGMPGGPENPLGARALYLYSNGEDTLYRIHGTNEPNSIGKAMSSGCIRMLNENIEELYLRVEIGTRVVVLSADNQRDLYTSAL
jgi:lipoprotein-anchoring transpeptidase ErfK/SrfK